MRVLIFLLSFAMSVGFAGFAQVSDDFRDNLGIGSGGGILGWTSLESLPPLNNLLSLNGFAPLASGFPTYGYWGNIGALLGWRMGALGIHGETSGQQDDQLAKLTFEYSGLTLDYGLLVAEYYDLSVGVLLGGGTSTLSLVFDSPTSFEDAIVAPSASELRREFFIARPHAAIGFNLWLLHVQLSGAYLITVPSDWQQRNVELDGPPDNFNGWSLEVLISFAWEYPPLYEMPEDSSGESD